MATPDQAEELLGILTSSRDPRVDRSEEGEAAASEETSATGEEQPASVDSLLPKQAPLTPKSAFTRGDTHPLLLDILLLKKFGPQWLSWEPETIWSEIETEFGAKPSVIIRNKINAMKTMHLVDTPWTEWEVFNVVLQALTDNIPDFRILQKPSPDQIVSAITMMKRVKDQAFSEEVARFIAACFLDAGVYFLPPPVDFAQRYAAEPRYKCQRCGNIDTDDDNEMCDSCGAPQRMLEKTLRRDPESVRKRWEQVLQDGEDREYFLMEDLEDVQVAKLLRAMTRNREYELRLAGQRSIIDG